jgi:hypothetical protein
VFGEGELAGWKPPMDYATKLKKWKILLLRITGLLKYCEREAAWVF